MDFESLFISHKVDLHGRYIAQAHIGPFLDHWNRHKRLQIIGQSVLGKLVYSFQIGDGATRILIWSQMHGNESTTTKAILDLLNLLQSDDRVAAPLLEHFTFLFLPMVNPDGADLFTRENASSVDLNRDAQSRSQPESRALRSAFDQFKPHYCYNMHDQRTIYGVGDSRFPATVSFLAPAFNEARDISNARKAAMDLICSMNETLQRFIPNQVGRFDDTFNINCVGDTFQYENVPTILFEAGHFPGDYQREITRKYVFVALLSSFSALIENVVVGNGIDDYLNIPQNKIAFYDIVYKNVSINYDCNEIITNFAVQFSEILSGDQVEFAAYIAAVGIGDDFFGHSEFDAKGAVFKTKNSKCPMLEEKADFYLDDVKFENGKPVSQNKTHHNS